MQSPDAPTPGEKSGLGLRLSNPSGRTRVDITALRAAGARAGLRQHVTAIPTSRDAVEWPTIEGGDDIHASAQYRRAMIRVFTRRALDRALARAAV